MIKRLLSSFFFSVSFFYCCCFCIWHRVVANAFECSSLSNVFSLFLIYVCVCLGIFFYIGCENFKIQWHDWMAYRAQICWRRRSFWLRVFCVPICELISGYKFETNRRWVNFNRNRRLVKSAVYQVCIHGKTMCLRIHFGEQLTHTQALNVKSFSYNFI